VLLELLTTYFPPQIFDVFKNGSDWKRVDNQECRQYSLYFVMLQFLQKDPQARRKNELMRELRIFLSDRYLLLIPDGDILREVDLQTLHRAAARTLKDVHLMQGMGMFFSAYMGESFGLTDIRYCATSVPLM
jgi:hypothetical protein